jgi:hypothetical protein
VGTGEAAYPSERFIDTHAVTLGDDAFGLFDRDARLQGRFELPRESPGVTDRAFVEDADGGDVSHRLGHSQVFVAEVARTSREQIQRADHLIAQSHRYC